MVDAKLRPVDPYRAAMDRNDVARHPPGIVEVVDHQVEDHPARLRRVEQPVSGAVARAEAGPLQPHHGRIADRSRGDQPMSGLVLRKVADDVGDEELHAGALASGEDRRAILQRPGQGLLDDDVPAGGCRVDGERRVAVGCGAHVDDIDRLEQRGRLRGRRRGCRR